MQFTPKTDDEIEKTEKERKERWVWPIQYEYDFDIIGALEQTGDYGPYMDLEIRVFHPNGEWKQTLRDFIGNESPKLKALCYSVGLGARYEAGQVDSHDLNGKGGKCKLGIKKDKSGQYSDKNKITDYVRIVAEGKSVSKDIGAELNDEIPF